MMGDVVMPEWAAGVTRLDQYAGVWAMEPRVLEGLLQVVSSWDMGEHVRQSTSLLTGREPQRPVYTSSGNGVAVVEMSGLLTKYGSSIGEGTSAVELRRAIRLAARDPEVRGIMVRVDSPGGSTHGLTDLVDELVAAGRVKPTAAYVEDMGASAAYMLASAAGRVTAGRSAHVGSIGTYSVLYDKSALFAREGVKPVVVKAGAFKAIGVPGTEITPEQVADVQRVVDGFNGLFLAQVEAGRGLSGERLEAVANGRLYAATEAVGLGLIDGIESFEEAVASLAAKAATSKKEGRSMNGPNGGGRQAATIQEIRQACTGAPADFVLAQVEAGATLPEAMSAWIAKQAEAVAAAQAAAQAAAEEARVRASVRPGVPPVPAVGGDGPATSARAEVEALVQQRMQARGEPRHRAWSAVLASNAELRERLVAEANEK